MRNYVGFLQIGSQLVAFFAMVHLNRPWLAMVYFKCTMGKNATNITRNAVIVLYVLLECLKWISTLLSLVL